MTADLPKLRPQIITDRLLLRPFALSDEAPLFQAISASSELLTLQLNYGPVRAETEMRIRDKAVFAA